VTSTRARSLVRPWAGLAVAAVLLTGCSAAPAFEPGVAAQVDHDRITVKQVDQVAERYCQAAETQLSKGQVIAQHFLRGQTAAALALRAAAEQFAADQGVSADPSYSHAVQSAEQSLSSLSADQREALIAVQGAGAYVSAVELAAGRKIVAKQGPGSSSGSASGSGSGAAADKAAQAAGEAAFKKWLADHDVHLDPQFGVSISDGTTKPADTSLSYPVSSAAKSGAANSADPTYAATLPQTQRCG
jgi:peptidyl-prolyl cis-trans isomerase SurA